RSIPVAGTARDGRRDLPGEHGFRFFPGFYHHVPDTMRRIPFAGNANGVWDNLTAASGVSFARDGGRADLKLDQSPGALTPEALRETLTAGFEEITTAPPTACSTRRRTRRGSSRGSCTWRASACASASATRSRRSTCRAGGSPASARATAASAGG